MSCYENINGSLRTASKLYDNIGGTLRTVSYGYDNIGGTLRRYHQNYVPPPPVTEENIYNYGTENVTITHITGQQTVANLTVGAWRDGSQLTLRPCGESLGEPEWHNVPAEIRFAPVTWNRRYLCITFENEWNNGCVDFYPADSSGNRLTQKLKFGTRMHDEGGNYGTGTSTYEDAYLDTTYYHELNPIDTASYTVCADLSKLSTKTWCLGIAGRASRASMYSCFCHIKRIWKTDNLPSGILWSLNYRRYFKASQPTPVDSVWPSTQYDNTF